MPNNVRRQLRSAMKPAGIEGVTRHMLLRSVATAIDRQDGFCSRVSGEPLRYAPLGVESGPPWPSSSSRLRCSRIG